MNILIQKAYTVVKMRKYPLSFLIINPKEFDSLMSCLFNTKSDFTVSCQTLSLTLQYSMQDTVDPDSLDSCSLQSLTPQCACHEEFWFLVEYLFEINTQGPRWV